VKDVLLWQLNANIYPEAIVSLKHTGGAITAGANLAAGVAADAAVELAHPEGQPLGWSHLLDRAEVSKDVICQSDLWWLPEEDIVDHWHAIGTAGTAGKHLPRVILRALTDHSDDVYPLALDLLLGQQDVDRATIAGFGDDGDMGGLFTPPGGGLFVVEIGDQVVETIRPPDQSVGLCGVVDNGRARTPAWAFLVANDTCHLLACQDLAGLLSYLFGQWLVDRHVFVSSPQRPVDYDEGALNTALKIRGRWSRALH
jgi:hypothetical protein